MPSARAPEQRPEGPALPGQRPDDDLGDEQDRRDRGLDGDGARRRRARATPSGPPRAGDRDREADPHPAGPEQSPAPCAQTIVTNRAPAPRTTRGLEGEARGRRASAGIGGHVGPGRTRAAHDPSRAGAAARTRQPRSPSSATTAGSATPRTSVASIRTAAARPTPSCLFSATRIVAKIANTATITIAALVTVPPVAPRPRPPPRGPEPGVPRLADPLEDEDRVVHREPEEDHEREQRHPVRDRAVGLEVQQALGPVVLEHRDEDPVGGADRQQVEADHRAGQPDERNAATSSSSASPSTKAITIGVRPAGGP